MRLTNFRITNFRSIEDSGEVPLERVACLVGKNESGKTNCLQALVRVNPAPGQPNSFDINDDYPRKGLGDIEHELKQPGFNHPQVIQVTYSLSEDEIAALAKEFGEGTVKLAQDATIKMSVAYDRRRSLDGIKVDEVAAVTHLLDQAGVNLGAAKPKSTAKLVEMANTGSNPELAEIAATVAGWRNQSLMSAVIDMVCAFEPLYIWSSPALMDTGDLPPV